MSREDQLHVVPAEFLDRLDGAGQARARCLIGLRRTPETLAEEKLDCGTLIVRLDGRR